MTTVVVLSGDSTQLLRELQKVEAGERKLEKQINEVSKASLDTAGSVEKIGKAGRYGQTEMDKLLRELRKTGPEGGRQARAIEKSFQEAGTHGRRSVNRITREMEKLDPAVAKVTRQTKQIGSSFGPSTLAKISGVAGGIVSVGAATQELNKFLEAQEQILDRALEKQLALARAQQEAGKNLAAYTAFDRDDALQKAVPGIARRTGFSSLEQLTLALGTAASSGASADQAIAVVEAAANIERLNPENLGATSAGAVALMNKTGLADPRQAVALMQTAGTQAKITEPSAMIKELPKAVGATMGTLGSQDKEEAARQAAALFANITLAGEDSTGAPSATFQIKLASRLGEFFSNLEATQVDVRSQLQALESKKTLLERDRVRIAELEKVIPQIESLQDPGTLFGRIQALQKSPDIAREFVGGGFGEEQFRIVLSQMVDPQSAFSRGLLNSFESIQANPAFYQREVRNQQQGTPQLALAFAQNQFEAGLAAQQAFDIPSAAMASVRDITSGALAETTPGGIPGLLDWSGVGIQRGSLRGGDPISEAVSAIDKLTERRQRLASGGITNLEQGRVETLDSAAEAILTIVEQQALAGVISPDIAQSAIERSRTSARLLRSNVAPRYRGDRGATESRAQSADVFERIATILEEQLAESRKTAENTSPVGRGSPPPNYSSGLQSGADAAGRPSF